MHKRIIDSLELELPDYMNSLDQETLDTLSDCPEIKERIISCGVIDECLRIVTGSGQVREISRNGRLSPVSAIPFDEGRSVVLEFKGEETRKVFSSFIIKYSKNCLNKPELFINNSYVCDAEFNGFEFSAET